MLSNPQVHAAHPRGAGRIERQRVGLVVREVDAADGDGRVWGWDVDGALEFEEGEAGGRVEEAGEGIG